MIKTNELIKLLSAAKEAGVSSMEITPEGAVSIKFADKKKDSNIEQLAEEAIEQIAEESKEEEEIQDAESQIADWELHNPQEIERQIELGNLIELPSGEIARASNQD